MKLRCRPGDFALVIKGENSGKFVDVLEGIGWFRAGEQATVRHEGVRYTITFVNESGYFWWCRSKMLLVSVNGIQSHVGAITDQRLLPFRPPAPAETWPRKQVAETKDEAH